MSDLRTERLILRPIDAAEAERIVTRRPGPDDRWAQDFPIDGDVRGVTMFLRATRESGDQAPFGHYTITRLADGVVIGGAGFKGRPVDGSVEIGYGVAPSGRGEGLAAEAARALVGLARRHSLRRVVAETEELNLASRRTLERAGFSHVGIDDGSWLFEVRLKASGDQQTLRVLEGRFVLERLASDQAFAEDEAVLALVRGPDGGARMRRDDRAAGAWVDLWNGDAAHPPETTGMVAAIVTPLAAGGVPVWVAASFDGDIVLVPTPSLIEPSCCWARQATRSRAIARWSSEVGTPETVRKWCRQAQVDASDSRRLRRPRTRGAMSSPPRRASCVAPASAAVVAPRRRRWRNCPTGMLRATFVRSVSHPAQGASDMRLSRSPSGHAPRDDATPRCMSWLQDEGA